MANLKSKTPLKRSMPRVDAAKSSAAQQAPNMASTRAAPRDRMGQSSESKTKHAQLLAMLNSTGGTTIALMMKATGWQQHSVRGFLAGVVRKRMNLDLVSDVTDKGRVYRIKDKRRSHGKTRPAKSAA